MKLNNLPAIEVAQLNKEEMHNLARKTKVLINCVGPYELYGEPVLEACARSGTHYLDVTGESPWVQKMVRKYHSIAQDSGAIIIPQTGVESAPADLVTYALVKCIRENMAMPTKEVIFTVHEMKASPSGGTLATALGIFDHYSLAQIMQSSTASAICPVALPKTVSTTSLGTKLTGVRKVSDLGTLTTSIQGGADNALVHRSWGLLSQDSTKTYGPNFKFSPYMSVRNSFLGVLVHLGVTLGPLLLLLSPLRWLLKKIVTQPGFGPTKEDAKNEVIEYRAIGLPDGHTTKKAFGRLLYEGSLYELTGKFLAEGAATILQDEQIDAKKLGGGVLTAAMLGDGFIERLEKAGVAIQTKILNH